RNDVSTQVISSTPAESVPRMWSSATLAMVMSSMTRNVVIIVVTATMARWTPGLMRLPQFDDWDDGHAGDEQRVAVLPGLEEELHGDGLDRLQEVAGGVLGRQEGEARAGAALDRVHARAEGEPGMGVHRDRGALARPHVGELRLLVVRDHPDVGDVDHGEQE